MWSHWDAYLLLAVVQDYMTTLEKKEKGATYKAKCMPQTLFYCISPKEQKY